MRARVRVRVQGEVLPVNGLIGGEERVPVVDHHDPEQLHLKKRKFSSECTTQKAGRQRVCVCVWRRYHGRFKIIEAEDPIRALQAAVINTIFQFSLGVNAALPPSRATRHLTCPNSVLYHAAFNQSQLVVRFIFSAE